MWAGDSRCYLLDSHGLRQLTKDDIDYYETNSTLYPFFCLDYDVTASWKYSLSSGWKENKVNRSVIERTVDPAQLLGTWFVRLTGVDDYPAGWWYTDTQLTEIPYDVYLEILSADNEGFSYNLTIYKDGELYSQDSNLYAS